MTESIDALAERIKLDVDRLAVLRKMENEGIYNHPPADAIIVRIGYRDSDIIPRSAIFYRLSPTDEVWYNMNASSRSGCYWERVIATFNNNLGRIITSVEYWLDEPDAALNFEEE